MSRPAYSSGPRTACVPVSPAQLETLCDFLHRRTGIAIRPHQRHGLLATLERAVERFGDAHAGDYIDRLPDCRPDSDELEFLIANVTVGESYFFRDKAQMEFLRTDWLTQCLAHKQGNPDAIRIWSAGSSQGQEIYSMAIMLRESLPTWKSWNLHLHATDINAEALSAAVTARYTAWSFRSTPEAFCKRYFTRVGQEFQLREEIRSMVDFSYLNLVEDEFPMIAHGLHSMDLILCRNVFIYFDAATIEAVMKKFARCLAPGGILLLGSADLINVEIDGLELERTDDLFYYRRTGTDPVATLPEPVVTPLVVNAGCNDGQTKRRTPEAEQLSVSAGERSPERITALVSEQRWSEVLEMAQRYLVLHGENAAMLQHLASALAGLGRFEEAREALQRALQMAPMEKHGHFLHALVLVECGEPAAAEKALGKALFIDPRFLEAHYQLGLLQLRLGQSGKALKSLGNALEIVQSGDPERTVYGAPDMSYQRMGEVLRKEIDIYSTTERKQ